MSKIFIIGNTHAFIYPSDYKKWMDNLKDYFYNFYIPFLKKNYKEGDICIHLGNLFDNKTHIQTDVIIDVEKIITNISEILPIHILIGKNDIFTKSNTDYNLPKIYRHIDNVHIHEKCTTINLNDKKIQLIPYISKKKDFNDNIKNDIDYLFTHIEDSKLDLNLLINYKGVYVGNNPKSYKSENITSVGSIYQMNKDEINNSNGIYILNLNDNSDVFIPNTHSPIFKEIEIVHEDDILVLDDLKNSLDYIDILVSNKLLVDNRKIRRKLEILLDKGKFNNINYIDDIEKVEDDINNDDVFGYDINMDYVEYIEKYIDNNEWDTEEFKESLKTEFKNVVNILESKTNK